MASSSQFDEQFICPICLDVFVEPVSTPCGHNYCKGCLTDYWAASDLSQCPLCQETFHTAPELQVNVGFRELLELFMTRMRLTGDGGSSPARPGDVPCDLCPGRQRKAQKSCLVCLASYCDAHLEPHHTVQALKWHKLINPVATLEDRVCRKHNNVMEFFCCKDQSCVCSVCLTDNHVMHETVSLEEELKKRKTQVKRMKGQVRKTLDEKRFRAERLQIKMVQGRQEVEKTKAEITKAFAALVASIETKKKKLVELLEEKQRAAEQQTEALLQQLQLEINKYSQASAKLEELSETEDDFKLLQGLPSISSPSDTGHHLTARVHHFLLVETVRNAAATMEEMFNDQIENVIREVSLVGEEEAFEEQMNSRKGKVFDDELGKIQRLYAKKVTLDPNTAHPCLILSGDRKEVRDGGTRRKVPDSPVRFDFFHYVLGNEGFSSGSFYYEVELKGLTGWEVGVVRESINRKGFDLSLSPEHGCWTLGSYWGRFQANANPPVTLSSSKEPQKVGVLVDYEGRLVSFYNVDSRSLIYSFTGCSFTANVPFQSKSNQLRVNTGTPAKTRIYPLFRPGDSAALQITPV